MRPLLSGGLFPHNCGQHHDQRFQQAGKELRTSLKGSRGCKFSCQNPTDVRKLRNMLFFRFYHSIMQIDIDDLELHRINTYIQTHFIHILYVQ